VNPLVVASFAVCGTLVRDSFGLLIAGVDVFVHIDMALLLAG
jgi:hypothetical protein